MKLTELEKKLLRQQAEAYAFISDLRRIAIINQDVKYAHLTEGVDFFIEKRQKEYPIFFKRYFNEALKRAEFERINGLTTIQKTSAENHGNRKEAPRRKEKTQEEEKIDTPQRTHRRRPHIKSSSKKSKPE